MSNDEKFWLLFWALIALTLSVIVICVTVASVAGDKRESKEALSRIEHGCRVPPLQQNFTYLHEEEMARIEHGCLAPEPNKP